MKTRTMFVAILAASFLWLMGVAAQADPPVIDGLIRHYDAGAIQGLSDGEIMSTWTDLSGNQDATAYNEPTWRSDSINGLPAVTFDGLFSDINNEYFQIGDLSTLTAGQAFIVFKRTEKGASDWNYSGLWRFGTSQASHVPAPGNPPSTIYDCFGSSARKNSIAIAGDPLWTAGLIYSASSAPGAWRNVLNGVELFTTTANSVAFESNALLGTSALGTATTLSGDIAELLLYNRVLTTEEENAIGTYLGDKYGITNSYPPTYIYVLAPDGFEDYDDSVLQTLWTSSATLSLDSSQVYSGDYSMKAVLAEAGSITKDTGRTYDYNSKDGRELSIWFKGDSSNAVGDVTLMLLQDDGEVVTMNTFTDGTIQTQWTSLRAAIEGDPSDPNVLANVQKVQIDIGAAATMYFDDMAIVIPPAPAQKVVEWKFNESSGKTAYDSSGNDINGTLSEVFVDSDWVIDGGHTGEASDNSLRFMSNPDDPNYVVLADNITLPEGVTDIFAADSSWTINQWIYLIQQPGDPQGTVGGGFGAFTGESAVYRMFANFGSNPVNIGFAGGTSETNVSTSTQLDMGEWNMVTFVYDKWAGRLKIYKNGVQKASRFCTFDDAPHNIYVGIKDNEANAALNALIDDFSVWDQALSQEEILDIWGDWICSIQPTVDFDGNCRVDLADFVYFVSFWMECARQPDSFCGK